MTDTMKLWDAVAKTNPADTKHVNQRGGFTSINATSQIMAATRQFGPIGTGWGYIAAEPIFHETLLFVPVTLWHGNRDNTFGPMLGCEEWKDKNGRIDSDAGKKATTDALTKLLSQIGFNADVFLGLYDDNKYVEQMRREFAPEPKAAPDPAAFINDKARDKLAMLIAAAGQEIGAFCKANGIMTLKELTNARAAELAGELKNAA
jgi:hypothetical protein